MNRFPLVPPRWGRALAALLLGLLPVATVLAAEAVCPLPQAEVEKATRAFSAMATVFRDPRCSNCHGAVNPYAEGGGHTGGKITLDNILRALGASRAALVEALTKATGAAPTAAQIADAEAALKTFASTDGPLTDRSAIQDILKLGGLEEVASAPCAECHQNRPAPWRLATSLWAGKSEEDLCAFFQQTMDPSNFLQHVTEDQTGFVQTGFAGTRGLTPFGQGVLKDQTGRSYAPEPPKGLSAAAFTEQGNRWVTALGDRFHKPPSCGCAVRNYRMILKGIGAIRVTGGGLATSDQQVEQAIDLSFDKDGGFTGQSRNPVTIANVLQGPGMVCKSDMVIDETMDIAGKVDEKSGTLKLTVTTSGLSRPTKQVCQVAGRTVTSPLPPVASGPESHAFQMPALVATPQSFVFQPAPGVTQTGIIRIERR